MTAVPSPRPPVLLDINKILKKLPHRYPFLLVDRVIEFERDKRIKAIKNVTFNEPFFAGHFPVKPVMPGVLILEALAQTAALLSFESAGQDMPPNTVVYFVGIDAARFKRPVEPGDQLVMEVFLDRHRAGMYKYKSRAFVDGEVAAEAELMCTMRAV
jgi:3-hydroxyacyl-[acyl-carrier-protein] dehydratase